MHKNHMFEYKDAEYFSEYFRNRPEFELVEEFKVSEDKEEQNLYVGQIEVKDTIHPLVVRVEIPFTFPHNKLTFRTKSLSGYPHLIHTGKIEYGDWFCLNTPFAETVEEQLNQEIQRLEEWISIQMNPNLPPVIEDPAVAAALAIATAYTGENPDEVNEYRSDAMLTFVGDRFDSLSEFEEMTGFFNCIKTPDNRYYVLDNEIKDANCKLPYVIVQDFPASNEEIFSNFALLKDFYNWDDTICKHLLSDSNLMYGQRYACYSTEKSEIEYTESDALRCIDRINEELLKETSHLNVITKNYLFVCHSPESELLTVPQSHKDLLLSELKQIKLDVIKDGGIRKPRVRLVGDEDDEELALINYWDSYGRYKYHHFVIGFVVNNKIYWLMGYTNPDSLRVKQTIYDIDVKFLHIKELESLPCAYTTAQRISKKMYFGRGEFCSNLINKRIGLVGIGAIGSMVAEALAHSGVHKIGLWDSDIVEPGNICRSAFSLGDIGLSKVEAIGNKIKSINAFIESESLILNGYWFEKNANCAEWCNGSFYDNINYSSQERAIEKISQYDMIIDCTGRNEILHFLSYAVKDKDIISLCITNGAKELVCVTNADGNPFELRKAYLSRIEQDTKNFYAEGDGCYSPTFVAKYSDIASLVNLFIKELDKAMEDNEDMHSAVYGYCKNGILIDRIRTFRLEESDIILNVPEETLLDAQEMEVPIDGNLGYVLGAYSADGKQIMVTHITSAQHAMQTLADAYKTSNGIIDYIGDYSYSDKDSDSFTNEALESLACKASDPEINTNNPLLALRTKNGDIVFYLYINNSLVRFR